LQATVIVVLNLQNVSIWSVGDCYPAAVSALTEHHAMQVYWGSGSIASHVLDLGTRWMWVVSFSLYRFTPRGAINMILNAALTSAVEVFKVQWYLGYKYKYHETLFIMTH